jgi:hypothetical protein
MHLFLSLTRQAMLQRRQILKPDIREVQLPSNNAADDVMQHIAVPWYWHRGQGSGSLVTFYAKS